jgi:uncharacterized protein (TIGR00251 family)
VPVFIDSTAGATVTVRVTPRSGRTALAGVSGTQLLVRVAAAPVEGAANDALVALLAETLRIPRRAVRVDAGERSRIKRVVVEGYRALELDNRLAAALTER